MAKSVKNATAVKKVATKKSKSIDPESFLLPKPLAIKVDWTQQLIAALVDTEQVKKIAVKVFKYKQPHPDQLETVVQVGIANYCTRVMDGMKIIQEHWDNQESDKIIGIIEAQF